MRLRTCLDCGRGIELGKRRCALCHREYERKRVAAKRARRELRSGSYGRAARQVKEAAQFCALCGQPFTADDPPVADHILPRALGGSDRIENLRAAHRSCNARRGKSLAPLTG